MNILSISSILPIHDLLSHNDFVFQTYLHYKKQFTEDEITIIKPIKYDFNLFTILKGATRLGKLKRKYTWEIKGFQVEIFPFLSSWGLRNLHSLLTRSIFIINNRRIRQLISSKKIDVIHAQYIYPDGVLAYLLNKKYGIPYFVTSHHERYFFDHYFSRRLALKIFRNASKVLPINQSNASYFKSLGVSNIELTPLGFDESFLRKQKQMSNGKLSIFTASVLIPLKNIDKVILAIRRLVPTYNIRYTIIGKGPERENLENLVETLNLKEHVNFVDQIPYEKMADQMYEHDIFIMPSFFETFGRVYFECMAMGIPIICAKNSGIYGLFRENEEGLSVDHNNIDEIANALEYLIANPQKRMEIGIKGQTLVKKYTWEQVSKDLHERYLNSIDSLS